MWHAEVEIFGDLRQHVARPVIQRYDLNNQVRRLSEDWLGPVRQGHCDYVRNAYQFELVMVWTLSPGGVPAARGMRTSCGGSASRAGLVQFRKQLAEIQAPGQFRLGDKSGPIMQAVPVRDLKPTAVWVG